MSEERTIISFDYAIKTMLRDKANFCVLEGFLSELLKRKVTILDILESESNKDNKDGKTNRVDLKARMDTGEIAIFEIQYAGQADFFGKALYGTSKAIVEQISAGDDYNIKKVYSINIAYFELDTKREYLFHADMLNFKGMHYDEQIPFSRYDALTPPTPKEPIHPEYYLILPKKFDEQILSKFDEWIYTRKNSVVKKEFSAAGLQEASEKLDKLKMSPEELAAYEKFLMDRQ
ncbi:MAG: Rpn family recombination-promoting nuclease/putative transposase, partial [Fibromonadales bacterium]|nr:Rpn family recombination-promoting nuclease/putative transposase [Fibromonadales bacterium]